MKKIKDIQYAWAIKNTYKDLDAEIYTGFKGVYNWLSGLPVCIAGNKICLFKTRGLAGEYSKRLTVWSNRDKNKVVKVSITIKEI